MQKTTPIVLIGALALVAAALVGVTFAQIATPSPTATPSQTVDSWCINPDSAAPYCYNNGTACATGNCNNAGAGYCAGPQACNAYRANQDCSQYGYGSQQGANIYQGGRMGQCGRGW